MIEYGIAGLFYGAVGAGVALGVAWLAGMVRRGRSERHNERDGRERAWQAFEDARLLMLPTEAREAGLRVPWKVRQALRQVADEAEAAAATAGHAARRMHHLSTIYDAYAGDLGDELRGRLDRALGVDRAHDAFGLLYDAHERSQLGAAYPDAEVAGIPPELARRPAWIGQDKPRPSDGKDFH